MKSRLTASFIGSSMNPTELRRKPLPEVMFMGRSNVGKSSLINCLVNHKKLARTSGTPGKTRLFYFYEIEDKFLFVDPPGYGYARVSQSVRERWVEEMERYLRRADMLLGVVMVMDIRHAPTPIDYDMSLWMAESHIPTVYALNKADKLSRKRRIEAVKKAQKELSFDSAGEVISFSSQTSEGRNDLWEAIEGWKEDKR